jgi:radical SAM superfamily enzyme with C-terminal helix-hairpin-helix motif
VQRRGEETLGFPTEVIQRRQEPRRSSGTETHNEKSFNRESRVGAAAGRIELLVVGEVDWQLAAALRKVAARLGREVNVISYSATDSAESR